MLPVAVSLHQPRLVPVSILTRPGGRVLRGGGHGSRCRGGEGFNPHPARGPGAARWPDQRRHRRVVVSILTRPGGRVLRNPPRPGDAGWLVSILTRPGGRVLQEDLACLRTRAADVSILTRPGGRVLPGGTGTLLAPLVQVSILTRPGGRVLPRPPRRLGRTSRSFNPHPARGPGAADSGHHAEGHGEQVSILTRPGGRVLPVRDPSRQDGLEVSILTRPGGRVLPQTDRPVTSTPITVSILTRPRGPGAAGRPR